MSKPSFTELSRSTVRKGRKFDFEVVTLRTPAGKILERECVRHPGAVVILPILDRPGGSPGVVFVQNERFTIGRALLELPAGTRELGEEPQATAARELEEETGYRAATITPLCRFYTTPGMTDELMWAYAATGLTPVGMRPEDDEALTPVVIPADEALRRAEAGEIHDGKSILTLLLAKARGIL